jgi:TonB family protein
MTDSWKTWEGQVADGQFHLRRFLGATDRSAVFLTEIPAQESQVAAIKFIPADPDTGEIQLTRWRLAAKLAHPHLARIYSSGRCLIGQMSLLYVVMEYADEDLSQILPQRALTEAEVRDLLPPVLEVMAYLHGEGFVHNRLKPANIMAVEDQLKISSDGLRRAGKTSASQSKPGPYDSPEAAAGGITPAGDVWSLGMTLVEILTQRLPAWEHFSDGEPSLPGALPAAFTDLARHCLRRDPAFRWTVADIGRWLQTGAAAPQSQLSALQPVNSASRLAVPIDARPSATPSPKMFVNWRYGIPVGIMAFVIMAMLAGPRLFSRHMEAQPAPSSASKHARPQPKSNSGGESGDALNGTPSPAPVPASLKTSQPAANSAPAAKSPAAGLVAGQVLEQALPNASEKARNSIQGIVRVSVRVQVDPSGSVSGAALNSPSPSKYFADQALRVAPRWKFVPATLNGQNVSSEWILRFDFSNSGTTVHPAQATP